jgi:hypothetical protein
MQNDVFCITCSYSFILLIDYETRNIDFLYSDEMIGIPEV